MGHVFHSNNYNAQLGEKLGLSLGQGLGNGINSYFANKAIDDVVNDPSLKDVPQSVKMGKLQSALAPYGETGMKMFQQRMQTEEQEMQEKEQKKLREEQEILGKHTAGETITSKERAKLSPKTQLELQKSEKNKKQASNMKEALKRSGVPEEMAEQFGEVYESATEGGKTDLLKHYNEMLQRGRKGYFKDYEKKKIMSENASEIPEEENKWPEIQEPEGMTPTEQIRLQASREKHNLPLYESSNEILHGLEDEHRDIQRLKQLDERDNLPVGTEKWDINWETGEPRFSPSTLHPDAQLYIKTIANMLGKAKNFFPGRVTNFDLDTFRKRFPTLANSKEGRILIQKQLELANRIAYLREETFRDAMDNYGAGADPIQIRKIANEKYKKEKIVLEDRLKTLDGMLDEEYQKNLTNQDQSKGSVKPGMVQLKDPKGVLRWVPEDVANQIKGNQ